MRDAKCFTGRAHKIAFQRFLRRKCYGMQQKIDTLRFTFHFFKKRLELGVAGDVARKERSFLTELAHKFLNVFLQPFALIIENQSRARIRPSPGNRPGDAALVSHAKHDAGFARQNLFLHSE